MKNELSRKIMKERFRLRAKTHSHLKDNDEDKKAKGIKNSVIKRKLKFELYNCLEAAQIENK